MANKEALKAAFAELADSFAAQGHALADIYNALIEQATTVAETANAKPVEVDVNPQPVEAPQEQAPLDQDAGLSANTETSTIDVPDAALGTAQDPNAVQHPQAATDGSSEPVPSADAIELASSSDEQSKA